MSLLRRSRRAEARSTRHPTLPYSAYASLFAQTSAGVPVSQETAVRSAAVAACVRILKTTVSMLPVDEVRVVNGTRQPVDTPSPVVRRPSARVSRRAWVAQVMHSLLTNGNFYGLVVAADGVGRPVQVETIAPGDVTWIPRGDGVDVPHVNGVPHDLWPLGGLVHIPASAFLRPGRVVADSPVDLAREAIGTALAAERFGAQFFGDGAHPTSIIYSDQELDEAAAKNVKQRVVAAQTGREPAVFGSGLKYEQIQINPDDSQFLDLLRFEVEQACRFWGVPPQMVYAAVSGQNVTYANVNQADLQYLKYSVANWLADIEDAWSSWLADPNVVKFNVNALLRMDTPTRFKSYETALRGGWMSVNEVRTLEDQPRIPDGDQYLWPPWRQFPLPESDADPDEDDA